MKQLTITISFKNSNVTEIELYKWLSEKSSYSGFVKDELKKIMEKEKRENGKNEK